MSENASLSFPLHVISLRKHKPPANAFIIVYHPHLKGGKYLCSRCTRFAAVSEILCYCLVPCRICTTLTARIRCPLCGLAAGEGAARDALITHNLRLVVYIAKKFESSTAGVEDMISIGTIGLIKAVNTFEPGKNIKLATYASRCIENEILMYLRKSSNRRQDASIDEPLNTDSDGNELLLMDELERNAERSALLAAVQALNPRERQIMELRFGLRDGVEHTQKEVADSIGISQSYISRLEKRIIKRLRQQIESLV